MASLKEWADKWIDLACFTGACLSDAADRIDGVLALWNEPVASEWLRGPERLHDPGQRDRRGGGNAEPNTPEWKLECEVLYPPGGRTTTSLGWTVVDGVNALPLTTNPGLGREGNVEADMLLLVKDEYSCGLQLIEVKVEADNPWYAAVENLRQLKLFSKSLEAQRLFHTRCSAPDLPEELHVTGVVLAPHAFYKARGQKANSVEPAQELLCRIGVATGINALLTTWDSTARAIEPL